MALVSTNYTCTTPQAFAEDTSVPETLNVRYHKFTCMRKQWIPALSLFIKVHGNGASDFVSGSLPSNCLFSVCHFMSFESGICTGHCIVCNNYCYDAYSAALRMKTLSMGHAMKCLCQSILQSAYYRFFSIPLFHLMQFAPKNPLPSLAVRHLL